MLRFDHLIFWVETPERLQKVCRAFEAAGFSITDRADAGRATAATAQRLVCFADGSYAEILTLRDPLARKNHRLAQFGAQGDGWADYSLLTDDLESWIARLRKAGLPFDGPKSHEKQLEDGRPWGVRLINPGRAPGHVAAPFILEDTVGPELRIPRENAAHANGATGLLGVRLLVEDLSAADCTLGVLFGAASAVPELPPGAAAGHRYPVAKGWVDVFEPTPGAGPLAQMLRTRGEGLFSAVFSGPETRSLALFAAGPFADAMIYRKEQP